MAMQEKDIIIPAELDPAQNTIFPDFEPNEIKKLVSILGDFVIIMQKSLSTFNRWIPGSIICSATMVSKRVCCVSVMQDGCPVECINLACWTSTGVTPEW